jgi:hypothetical protein
MIRSLILFAAIGIGVLVPLGPSTPALAQTCQQKCESSYPDYRDGYQRRMKGQCLRQCASKK